MIPSGFMEDLNFEWRESKHEANVRKHGVDFQEALTVFADPLARVFDDPDHSTDEMREIIVGHSTQLRLLVASFTEREDKVRIMRARAATSRERHDYEQGANFV